MKTCSRCKVSKPVSDFSVKRKATGNLQPMCRECNVTYQHHWYTKNKTKHIARVKQDSRKRNALVKSAVQDYMKDKCCVDCGMTDARAFQFDHVRGTKRAPVSKLRSSNGASLKTIMEEIAKCDIRCANCHQIKTHFSLQRPSRNARVKKIQH